MSKVIDKERGSDDVGGVGGHASLANAFVFWAIKPFLSSCFRFSIPLFQHERESLHL